jgi:hypothetical protein
MKDPYPSVKLRAGSDLPPRTGEGTYLALPDPPVSVCLDNEKTLLEDGPR